MLPRWVGGQRVKKMSQAATVIIGTGNSSFTLEGKSSLSPLSLLLPLLLPLPFLLLALSSFSLVVLIVIDVMREKLNEGRRPTLILRLVIIVHRVTP
ncbi:hypothetical protein M0804_000726 [Polistes exclamans]|nr:hypothetical protein M0804_000726 [Polistes exclamans]